MKKTNLPFASRSAGTALALSLGLALAGCGGVPTNASLYSVHQPVVEQVNYTLDVQGGADGLATGEARRLAGWFDAMDVKFGDKVTIDDPMDSYSARAAVESIAGRYGLLLGNQAPQTAGYIPVGSVRIVITRTKASVPGCPDWSSESDFNPNNGTSSNHGCATNSNLAAMVANPEHLLKGADNTGETVVMSSSKAITTFREAAPTGKGGLKETGSKDN